MNNQALIARTDEHAGEMIKTLDDVLKLSTIVAQSGMFPDIQSQARAAMIIIAGQEIGVPPMASLRGLYVQKGKVEIHAGLLAAMIKSSAKYEYRVVERTDELCRLGWYEEGKHVGDSQYTIEDAKRAQLIKPDSNWSKSPRAMCFARALTEGQRVYAPDIAIGSAYSQGEIPNDDGDAGQVSDAYETIGLLLRERGQDDSKAARYFVLNAINNGAYQAVAQQLNVPVDSVLMLAKNIKRDIAVTHARIENDLADAQEGIEDLRLKQAAERLQPSIDKIEEARRMRENAPDGLRAVKPPVEAELPPVTTGEEVIEPAKPPADPDPVAPLKVTLTAAQQKVSDAVMTLWKEHKKDKAACLKVVGEVVGREVTKSADLNDEEAERVYKQLEAWASTLAGLSDAPPTKPKPFNQRNRNHSEEIGKRLDAVYQRMTINKVGIGQLTDRVNEILDELGMARIETRYALDDQCAIQVCEIFEDWANDLESKKNQ